jgi:hypothetical protein
MRNNAPCICIDFYKLFLISDQVCLSQYCVRANGVTLRKSGFYSQQEQRLLYSPSSSDRLRDPFNVLANAYRQYIQSQIYYTHVSTK